MRNLLLDNSLFGRFLRDLGFPLGCISIHSSGRADDTLCSAVTRAVNGCRKRSGNEENGPTITTSFSSTSPGSGGAGNLATTCFPYTFPIHWTKNTKNLVRTPETG